jgi:predicted nucleotidyltransferase
VARALHWQCAIIHSTELDTADAQVPEAWKHPGKAETGRLRFDERLWHDGKKTRRHVIGDTMLRQLLVHT